MINDNLGSSLLRKTEFVERYKAKIIKKTGIPEKIAKEMANDAWDAFGQEDSPEDCVDSELSYWGN